MSDQQGSSGCAPSALVILGVILLVIGVIVFGIIGQCASDLSHLGGPH
jgi:hypothetical protein